MGDIAPLPSCRPPLAEPTGFFTGSARDNLAFAVKDLARSGLTIEDMGALAPAELDLPQDATAGYFIPYYDTQGRVLRDDKANATMYRIRLAYPEWSRAGRYLQPSAETLATHGLPSSVPYLPPLSAALRARASSQLLICEGEKKTAAAIKHLHRAALGIGGCQMWRHPSGNGGVHPWIEEYLRALSVTSILIVPDADIMRYDICAAYGSLARRLVELGFACEVLRPPAKLDDWIVEGGTEATFDQLPRVPLDSLVQTPALLAERLDLSFITSAKGNKVVPVNTSNLTKIVENSGSFPEVWRNVEDARVYLGDTVSRPDCSEVEIANHIQHYMGFHQATHTQVRTVMGMLAERNSRSPLLEQLKRSHWDGVERLDTWGQTYWGIADTPYNRAAFARWLVASCARLDKPGVAFDWMLVVIGPSGIGKSKMPSIFWGDRALTLLGAPKDNDLYMLIHQSLCINFDELDFLTKRDTTGLLGLLTRQTDSYRAPYAASISEHARRCVFYGCGNEPQFLQHHEAFARRFAIVEAHQLIDFARLREVVPQLWAEAWQRYQMGTEWWRVPELDEAARDKYLLPDVDDERIANWVESQRVSKITTMIRDGKLWFTMSQLMEGLNSSVASNATGITKRYAAILRKLGATQVRCSFNGQIARWYTVPLDAPL